jgi:serine protease
MRISHLIVGAALAAATLSSASAERMPRSLPPLADAGPARVIVQFKEGAPAVRAHALAASASMWEREAALAGRAQALASRHGLALRSGAAIGLREQVVHGPAAMSSADLAARLAADPDVAFAVPDRRVRRTAVPNDSLFAAGGAQGPAVGQWYLRAPSGEVAAPIDAVRAWDTTQGSAGVIVAVLDTGVRSDHPELSGKLVAGYDFVSNEPGQPAISNDGDGRDADARDPGDWLTQSEIDANPSFWEGCEAATSSWHGTQVAGIVGAATDNGGGMAGTGWNTRVMPLRVLGKCFGYTSDIQAAMRWAAGIAVPGVPDNPNPVQVINLSLGGSATCSSDWISAISAVTDRGVVVVAAAGNSAGHAASAPANCSGVIGVAGVRHAGSKVGFSDVGPELAIAAPGGNCVNTGDNDPCLYPILTTADTGSQGPVGAAYTDSFNASVGTSFSSPLVAGTVALMLSARPGLTPAQVSSALRSSARPFPSSGLIDGLTGQPLQTCQAPSASDQLECYCTKSTCGAGLLDAGGAVAAALAIGQGDGGGGGGGGGATSPLWLLALAAATALLLGRRGGAALAISAIGIALAAPEPSWAAGDDERMVHGLIVQLRDAPTHAALARDRASALAHGTSTVGAAVLAEREQARWLRVVGALPAATRVAQRRAVGASAQLLRFERPVSTREARALAAQLASHDDVAWAAPNAREKRLQAAGSPPSDPRYPEQWWLQSVASGSNGVPDFLGAWTQRTTGSASAIVAVLDNGIVDHPDLAGKVIPGYDLVADSAFSNDGDGRDADPTDPGDWVSASDLARPEYAGCQEEASSWHGTAIAGMLAANVNNGAGGAGINWPGRVLAVRVAAKCGADVADIVDGMRWVAGRADVCRRSDALGNCLEFVPVNPTPARVINISFGGTGSCDAYQGTIDELRALDVVVVAAAGNEHAATPTRPAKCPGVIGVGALNRDGYKSTYSNFGSTLTVSTVGGDDPDGAWGGFVADTGLLGVGNTGLTGPGSSAYFSYYGTSFSTPIVAGAIGLMLAVNPGLTADRIEQGLRISARPHVTSTLPGVAICSNANPGRCLCTTATCGAGILDVPQALAYAAAQPGTYVTPVRQPALINTSALAAAAAIGPDRPPNASEPPAGGGSDDGGGGGGTTSPAWLLGLVAAVVALAPRRRSHAIRSGLSRPLQRRTPTDIA